MALEFFFRRVGRIGLPAVFTLTAIIPALAQYPDRERITASATDQEIQTERISFNVGDEKIVGVLTRPSNDGQIPVVLILHGRSGNRDGPKITNSDHNLLTRTAMLLARSDFANLRISTRGKGGSDGDFTKVTIERRVEEVDAAIGWLANKEGIDRARINILGFSQGAIVAAAIAGSSRNSPKIASVTLWAPNIHRVGGIKTYRGPLLGVMGRYDSFRRGQRIEALATYHQGPHVFWTIDTGHRLGAQQGLPVVDALIWRCAQWMRTQNHN